MSPTDSTDSELRQDVGVVESRADPRPWDQSHPGTVFVFLLAGVVVVGAGVKAAAPVLTPFLLGSFVAIVSAPLLGWLGRRGAPRVVAVGTTVLADAAVLFALGWLVSRSVVELTAKLPTYTSLLARNADGVKARLAAMDVRIDLPDLVHLETVTSWATNLLGDLVNFVWNVAFAIILAAFLLYEMSRPGSTHSSGHRLDSVRYAAREVNKYVAIKTVVSMITGCLVAAWLVLWDADLPVLFGLLAFVLNYIPSLGSILASLPAIGLAFLQGGVAFGLEVMGGYLLINVTIGNVVEPRVMGRVLGLSPLVVLVSVVVWGFLLGPVGALLSALLTVLVKLGLSSTEDLRPYALYLGPATAGVGHAAVEREPKPADIADIADLVVPRASGDSEDDGKAPPS